MNAPVWKWKAVGLVICCLLARPGRVAAADSRVLYAPDVVGVERVFMIALSLPVEAAEVAVTVPAAVETFDRTRLPARSQTRKFYFRALKRAAAVATQP